MRVRAGSLVVASLLVATLVAPRTATAQTGGNIDLNAFRPSTDSRGFITANASQPLGHKELSFGLVLNWGHGVLEFSEGDNTYTVENVISANLQAAFGLFRVIEIGVTAPVTIISGDVGPDSDNGTPTPNDDAAFAFDAQGVGDVGVHAKVRLLNTSIHPVGVAVVASVYTPGGYDPNRWLGENGLTIQPSVIVDKELWDSTLRIALNVGLRLRTGEHRYEDVGMAGAPGRPDVPGTGLVIDAKTELPFALALSYAIVKEKFDVVAEVFGGVPLGGENYMPLEAIAGVKLYLAKNSFFLLGGGLGLVPGAAGANPDVRGFMGIIFEPSIGDRDGDGFKDDIDQCPDEPEDRDDFEDLDGCPEPDNDRDGLLDEVDSCPNEPEDKDGVDDEDGCPDRDETDRDGDGMKDDVDSCPDDPEDFDQFEDLDGCPEPDNDKDSILDTDDLCPNDPEDFDKWDDVDGCPDPDNDKDRILDKEDDCVNEPETYNGKEDDDGCPDRGLVVRTDTSLEILEKIYFETDKAIIKGEQSFAVLDAVAATMIGNPDIELVEVQGHTDVRNNDEYNLKLSQERAEAVRDYLAGKGVEDNRLQAKGYGEGAPIEPCSSKPECTGKCEQACSTNRRVEFIIRTRK